MTTTTTTTSQSSTKKLSTLIREGAAIHPHQAYGQSAVGDYDAQDNRVITGTCALGAAYVALIRGGSLPSHYEDDVLFSSVPILFRKTGMMDMLNTMVPFPDVEAYVPPEREMTLYDAVTALNDLAR